MPIEFAETEQQSLACYPTMVQLRSRFSEKDFVNQVKRQMSAGYRLVSLKDNDKI